MWELTGRTDDEYRLAIRATRVSLRQLTAIIVGCVLVGGAAATAMMIAFTTETGIALGRSLVIAASGALAIVVALALLWVFSWRRKHYVIHWGDSGIRITGAGRERDLPWSSVTRILIRTNTDYARVEVRTTDGRAVTLLAGFGSQDVRKAEAIDPIPAGVIELFRRQGFVEQAHQRNAPGLHLFAPAPA